MACMLSNVSRSFLNLSRSSSKCFAIGTWSSASLHPLSAPIIGELNASYANFHSSGTVREKCELTHKR